MLVRCLFSEGIDNPAFILPFKGEEILAPFTGLKENACIVTHMVSLYRSYYFVFVDIVVAL